MQRAKKAKLEEEVEDDDDKEAEEEDKEGESEAEDDDDEVPLGVASKVIHAPALSPWRVYTCRLLCHQP